MASTPIQCDTHGTRIATVVCQHLLDSREKVVGFIENNEDPNDLQAWCNECEALFLEEDGLTQRFRAFNDFRVVCEICYASLKARHSAQMSE